MPGFVTHYLFGVNVLRGMQKRKQLQEDGLLRDIKKYKTVFQLGLQGPDIFFYDLLLGLKPKNPGSILHTERTGDFILAMLCEKGKICNANKKAIVNAYIAGFLGHYVLDARLHPYVYYRTEGIEAAKNDKKPAKKKAGKKGLSSHVALETDMDACLLMRYARCLPSEFPHGNTIVFPRSVRWAFSDFLEKAFRSVFPELRIRRRGVSRAILSMQLETRLLFNPRNTKRQQVEWLEQKTIHRPVISPLIPCDELRYSDDPLNMAHKAWCNPWDTDMSCSASVIDLIRDASGEYQDALRLLQDETSSASEAERARDREAICRLLGRRSYHSGIPV